MFSQARTAAAWLIGIIAALAAAVSLGQSYRGLFDWALHHAMIPEPWAALWPLMVDTFLVVGELWLLICSIDQAGWKDRIPAALITLAGLAASVAGNIGHVGFSAPPAVRWSAAVPPLAAAAALGVALRLVGQAVAAQPKPVRKPAREPARAPAPPRRAPARQLQRRRLADWLAEPAVATKLGELRRIQAAGGKLPTDRELARELGISRHAGGNLLRTVEKEAA